MYNHQKLALSQTVALPQSLKPALRALTAEDKTAQSEACANSCSHHMEDPRPIPNTEGAVWTG
jgi:hypothetical protein